MKRTFKAFTLLELIVVVVILGILAAIAIPSFLSVIGSSQSATAQSSAEALGRDAQAIAEASTSAGVTPDPNTKVAQAVGETNLSSSQVSDAGSNGPWQVSVANGKACLTLVTDATTHNPTGQTVTGGACPS